jgi:uncharacterized repeat protein (TIGR01451 family)
MLTKKGVYYLSGDDIPRRRILLVDPIPAIQDPLTWPFGLITSADKIDMGAAMAEEFYRVGIRWFHFDYPISDEFYMPWPYDINSIGASSDPNAGRITEGFETFINRAAELGLNPIFKLVAHYSQISDPTNLDGDFYNGLRKIQTYYKGKQKYWTIGNEVEGGGYSRFTPDELAIVIKNMSIALKGVDPGVKIIAGEFYDAWNQHLDRLILPEYRDYWDILSGHNMVRIRAGNAPVSGYVENLEGLEKPIWDTEANGTIFGGPSEWSNYMQSGFPVVVDADLHSGVNKHIARAFCLQSRDGDQWLPAFYNPDEPCLGTDLFIAMHYNANWETQWALRRHWINSLDQPSEQNHKVASFRTVTDMLYGTEGLTRIPNTDVPDPYNASPDATYERADGYIYKYGPEYILILWQNDGNSLFNGGPLHDREMVLTLADDVQNQEIVMFDSLGNRYPLHNNDGEVKVWVRPDAIYVRGFTAIPTFALDETGDDAPYFVTTPITQAVVGQPYYYSAGAYDSDTPLSEDNSLPRITYSLVEAPADMLLAVNTTNAQHAYRAALLTWTPTSPGSYDVTVEATSRHGVEQSIDQTFTIDVLPAGTNLAPQILSKPTTTFARAGYVWWYNVNAHDPNSDAVTYALAQAPPGMTIDPSSGFIEWTPTAEGVYQVTVTASDATASTSQPFVMRVSGMLPSPLLSYGKSAVPAAPQEGDTVTYTLSIIHQGAPVSTPTWVTDTLPTQLDFVPGSLRANAGTATFQNGQVYWTGLISTTPRMTITYQMTVPTSEPMIISNAATFYNPAVDTDQVTRSATIRTGGPLPPARLSYGKAAVPGMPKEGDTVTFALSIDHQGEPITTPTWITDTLPTQLEYVPDSLSANTGTATYQDGQVHWSGLISTTPRLTITYQMTVPPSNVMVVSNVAAFYNPALDADPVMRSAQIIIKGKEVYLPVILKQQP